jgi:hypothetical protein
MGSLASASWCVDTSPPIPASGILGPQTNVHMTQSPFPGAHSAAGRPAQGCLSCLESSELALRAEISF